MCPAQQQPPGRDDPVVDRSLPKGEEKKNIDRFDNEHLASLASIIVTASFQPFQRIRMRVAPFRNIDEFQGNIYGKRVN